MNKIFKGIGFVILLILISYSIPRVIYSEKTLSDLNILKPSSNMVPQGESELVIIYIGSSSCAASNIEELISPIKELKEKVSKHANYLNTGFHSIGVSKDQVSIEELKHLSKHGTFNEVIIGKSWSNLGVLKYIYNDFQGPPQIPQIIITKRNFKKKV